MSKKTSKSNAIAAATAGSTPAPSVAAPAEQVAAAAPAPAPWMRILYHAPVAAPAKDGEAPAAPAMKERLVSKKCFPATLGRIEKRGMVVVSTAELLEKPAQQAAA